MKLKQRIAPTARSLMIALVLISGASSCTDGFFATASMTGVVVSFSVAGTQASRAVDDQIRIRVNGLGVAIDTTVVAAPAQETRVRLNVGNAADGGVYQIVVEVRRDSVLQFRGNASAQIRSGQSTPVELALLPPPVTTVVVSPPASSIVSGATVVLTTTLRESSGALLGVRVVTWTSSAPAIASVSAAGVVTGVTPGGPVTITATSEGRSGTMQVTVLPVPVASVTVTPSVATVVQGSTTPFTATLRDVAGTVLAGRLIAWSTSIAAVASVSATGVVTGLAPGGPVTITAASEGRSGTAVLSVLQVPVATVTVSSPSAFVSVGGTTALTATLRDVAGTVLTGRLIAWSTSNAALASVSATGVVTGLAPGGPVTITAASEGRSGTAVLSVLQVPVATVTVTATSATVVRGTTTSLTAVTRDSAGTVLTGRTVVWSSSNSNVATVGATTGVVTGVAQGTATITATSEARTGAVTVTVSSGIASVTFTGPPFVDLLQINSSKLFTATVQAVAGANATITWRSLSPAIARINLGPVPEQVFVVGVAPGVTQVCATAVADTTKFACAAIAVGTPGVGFDVEQFAVLPAGSFQMGSANGNADERPLHTVNITRPFRMQRTEVTQQQWRAIMGTSPSTFTQCGNDCPLENISWDDIQQFLVRLNQQDPSRGYRLPTEAEWEYAARAGTTGDYGGAGPNGAIDMGWFRETAGGTPHRAAQKLTNAWGLYDMHGNVYEWVQDVYSATFYSNSPANDPTGPATGQGRVIRGGSWSDLFSNARSASRLGLAPAARANVVGFRLVWTQ